MINQYPRSARRLHFFLFVMLGFNTTIKERGQARYTDLAIPSPNSPATAQSTAVAPINPTSGAVPTGGTMWAAPAATGATVPVTNPDVVVWWIR